LSRNLIFALVFGGALATLSSCETVPKTATFSNSENSALLIVEYETKPNLAGYEFGFRQVDLESNSFISSPIWVPSSAEISSGKPPEGSWKYHRFAMMRLPEGHYVGVGIREQYNDGFMAISRNWCYSEMAPVFEIKLGEMTMYRTGSPDSRTQRMILNDEKFDPEQVKKAFAFARSKYPALNGSINMAHIEKVISWPVESSGNNDIFKLPGNACNKANKFIAVRH
jgi:hypothetical protein